MSDKVLSVLTFKSVETLKDNGGTQSWVLDRNRAKACKYVVICRNAYHDGVEGDEIHGHAFMLGKVKDIVPATDTAGRWLVLLSDYAVDDFGFQWEGRNPVAYYTTDDFSGDKEFKRIDFDKVEWKPMPEPGQVEDAPVIPVGLSLFDAKAGVALRYGVDPVNVEICVRL